MDRRDFLKYSAGVSAASILAGCELPESLSGRKDSGRHPNILFLSADDMSYDSLGVTGCTLPGISPNLDELARDGLLIENCHIMTPICGPSRHAWMTGCYPHRTGMMGHYNMPPAWFKNEKQTNSYIYTDDYINKHLKDQAGYYTGVFCKVPTGGWDYTINHLKLPLGRDPNGFYKYSKDFFSKAKELQKPFFLHANFMDPHEYWAGQKHETKEWIDAMMQNKEYDVYPNGRPYPDPKRTYQPKQIPVPACYPDIPAIREELVTYYNSVARMDECAGAVLKALKEAGLEDNTLVIFLSDNGIGKAFGKWSLYPYGTKTPLIVRWPGVVKRGRHDKKSVVSAMDIAPTALEAAGLNVPQHIDGLSFIPIIDGSYRGPKREKVFTCFNYMNNYPDRDKEFTQFTNDLAEKHDNYRPMRAINSNRYTYIWNSWANGINEVKIEMTAGFSMRDILTANGYKERYDFYTWRIPEEFYDTQKDPGCLNNLIAEPTYKAKINEFRQELLKVMTETKDHELENFRTRIIAKRR